MKPGDKIGRYELGQQIGEGAVAKVFASRHPVLEREVAIKVLKQEAFHDSHYVARFLDDARSAHRLDHPNIVRVLDVDEAAGRSFIVMELVDGQPLDRWMVGRRIEAAEAARIARDVARALAAAHGGGLVHRDVKPSNVLVDAKTGTAKLTDFGAAKRDRPDGVQLTEVGQRIGTPRYMAPEQVEGSEVDPRTDLFALGATLYELLAGRPAFDANTVSAAFHAILFSTPPSLTELRPDAPPGLVQLVERLLAKAPEARPSSAEEVVAELDAVLGPGASPTDTQAAASTLTRSVTAATATTSGTASAQTTGTGAQTTAATANTSADQGATTTRYWGGNMLRSRMAAALAAIALLLVLGIGGWWWLSPAEPDVATATPAEEQEAAPEVATAPPADEVAPAEEETAAEVATAPPAEEIAPDDAPQATVVPAPPAEEIAPAPEPDLAAAPPPEDLPGEQAAESEQTGELDAAARARWEEEQAAPGEELGAAARARWEEEQAELAAAAPGEELDAAARARWEEEQAEQAGEPEAEVAALSPGVVTPAPRETVQCSAPESQAPGCALAAQTLGALDGTTGAGPEITLNQPDGIYLDEEYLVIEASLPPDVGGYLYLDVLTDAGDVYHLLPEPMRENNELPPGGKVRVGVEAAERREGVRHWQVGEPFGEAYLIALVSDRPLYEGLRPIAEPLTEYRQVLLGALDDPARGETRASVQRVEFRPR